MKCLLPEVKQTSPVPRLDSAFPVRHSPARGTTVEAFSLSMTFSSAYDAYRVRLKAFYAAWLMGNSQNKSNGSHLGFEAEPLLNDQPWN